MDSWALNISGTQAAIIAWFLALISVGVQGYVFKTELIQSGEITFNIKKLDRTFLLWFFAIVMVVFPAAGVFLLGIVTNMTQAPLILMELYVKTVNLQSLFFVFAQWLLMVAIGYDIFFVEKVSINAVMAYAWYKIFLTTIFVGSFSLRLQRPLSFWYWDQYYALEMERLEQEQEELARQKYEQEQK